MHYTVESHSVKVNNLAAMADSLPTELEVVNWVKGWPCLVFLAFTAG
jgi:hypothetical protein